MAPASDLANAGRSGPKGTLIAADLTQLGGEAPARDSRTGPSLRDTPLGTGVP